MKCIYFVNSRHTYYEKFHLNNAISITYLNSLKGIVFSALGKAKEKFQFLPSLKVKRKNLRKRNSK